MTHAEYWTDVWGNAHERLDGMLAQCGTTIVDIVGDGNGIDSTQDARDVLAFVFLHCPTAEEKACAILSASEALQAWREVSYDSLAKANASAR